MQIIKKLDRDNQSSQLGWADCVVASAGLQNVESNLVLALHRYGLPQDWKVA